MRDLQAKISRIRFALGPWFSGRQGVSPLWVLMIVRIERPRTKCGGAGFFVTNITQLTSLMYTKEKGG